MPADIVIRILDASDRSVLDNVDPDVFDGPIRPSEAIEFLRDDRHHLVVAIHNNVVVGMASGVHYVHPDKAAEFWVNEVGVAGSYRGKGIGKALLAKLLEHGKSLGCAEAWVLTSSDNTPARKLYASAGGKEHEQPVYVTFDLSGGTLL